MNDISSVTPAKEGYCQCNCGEKTPLAKKTRNALGHKKGEPIPYLNGHNRRKSERYRIEDRGYKTPCWTWLLSKNRWGYGSSCRDGKTLGAHRHVWENFKGRAVRTGFELDHLCRNRDCVNPDHLEEVKRNMNIQRGELASLTPYGVFSARLMAATTTLTQREIGDSLGVVGGTIGAILRGHTWQNVWPS